MLSKAAARCLPCTREPWLSRAVHRQVSDALLEAAAQLRGLTAIDTGFSSLVTRKGVLRLLQLTGLQALSATGRCAQDFGLLQLEDVRQLAALTSLRLLEVRGPGCWDGRVDMMCL